MKGKWPQMVFLLAIGLGLATTYLVTRWMERQAEANATRPETVLVKPVVVAAVDLAPGATLRQESLKVIKWPTDSLPPGAFDAAIALNDRVVILPIVAGEPIIASKLAAPGTEGGMTAIISPGKRAMSVKVDEIIGVAGFVVPGTAVDVLVTLENRHNERLDAAAQAILQNIKVLASGQKVITEKNEPVLVNVVTLEVTPQQAEKLALASNRGRLQLALRNQTDTEELETFAIYTPELLRAPKKPLFRQEKPAPARQAAVEVIRGSQRTSQGF